MAQDTDLWEKESSTVTETTNERKPQESATGRDTPSGDGGVGDEQVNAISSDGTGGPLGQDHSTDMSTDREPNDGVGAVQDSSLAGTDIADITE
ncbi:MAG: hypothetical protein JO053_11020 [Acidobacteria bacterium]|nr:hypothetical protein [Acidobacteriota bacterium]